MSRYPIIFILLLVSARSAFAFDPFSIMAAAGAVASGISAISGAVGDVASTIDAFGELYSEIDSDAEVNPESKRLIQKIKEIEDTALDIGYAENEVAAFLKSDKDSAQDLEKLVKKLTRAIRTGKKISALFSKLEKKAQAAEVEQLSVQREQLKLQHRLLNEQIESRLDRRLEQLRATKDHQGSLKTIQKELRKRGALTFGNTGVLCFPKRDKVLQKAIEHANRTAPLFAGLILLAFLLRLLFYQFGFYGANQYGDLIRDALVCMFLLATFGQIVEGAFAISDFLSEKVAFGMSSTLQQPTSVPSFKISELSTTYMLTMTWIGSWMRFIVFVFTDFVFNFGLAFIIFLFPPVIFVSQMCNFPVAWPAFLSGFLLLTLWPFFWNATGVLAVELWVMDTDSISDILKTSLFSLLQCISPFVSIFIIQGQSVGAAVTSTFRSISQPVQPATNFVKGAVQAARRKSGGNTPGRMFGTAGRWGTHQAIGRVGAARAQYKKQPKGSRTVGPALSGFIFNEPTAAPNSSQSSLNRFIRGLKNPKPNKPKFKYQPSQSKKP